MNASRVKVLCGSRAVKNGKGAKGMSTKDIEKFVKEKLPKNLQAEFKRMQKKDRMSLCVLLSKFKNGQSLLQEAATPPKVKPVKSNDPFEEAARAAAAIKKGIPNKKNARGNFEITNENGNGNGNSNNNGSPNREVQGYGGNSPNEETKRKILGQRNWASIRRAEPDPVAKGAKLRGKLKGQINARLRRLKRTGKLPEGKTMAEILKNEMTKKPKNFKKRSPPKRTPKPAAKFINFGKTKSEATGKRPRTGQSFPAIYRAKGFSGAQMKEAKFKANKTLNSLNRAGLLPNAGNGNKFEQEMTVLRKELLNDQLSTMKPEGSKKPEQTKVSFNSTSYTGLNVNTELSRIKKMKAANKNNSIKRKGRIFNTLKRMRPSKPAYMKASKLVPNMGNGNSPNNSPSPERVSKGLNASNASIQKLKNKRNKGEKLSSPERKLLNVVNALRK